MRGRTTILLAVLCWCGTTGDAYSGGAKPSDSLQIANVQFREVQDRIVVSYDLVPVGSDVGGNSSKGTVVARNSGFRIVLLLKRESDGAFTYVPKYVGGDIGAGVSEGTRKQIVWDVHKEFPDGVSGNDYYFVVMVEPSLRQSNLWLWIGGGVAAAGGIVAAILTSHQGGSSPTRSQFPSPPGHP